MTPTPRSLCSRLLPALPLLLVFLPLACGQVLPPGIPTLTLSSYINFTLPPPLNSAEVVAAISALPSHTSTEAHTVRDHLPRFYGPSTFSLNDTTQTTSWVRGTAYYAIPGLVMAVLTLVTWVSFACYQCCCRRSTGYREESKRREYGVPAALLFFTLLACIFAAVGLAYNSAVTSGLTSTSGGGPSLQTTNTSIVYTPQSSTPGLTTAAQDILDDLQTFFFTFPLLLSQVTAEVNAVVPQIRGRVADASQLVSNLVALEQQLTSTLDSVESFSAYNYTCDGQCSAFLTPLANVTQQVSAIAVPVAQVVQADIGSIDASIVSSQDSINADFQSAISQLSDVYSQTLSYQDDANTAIDDTRKYNHDREAATVALLVLPLLSLVLLVVAMALHSSALLKVNVHLLFLVSIIMWLLFAVHLALTSGSADSCIYVDGVEVDLPSYVDTDVSNVLQACLLNTSLITAVNISAPLSFAFNIAIPNITAMEQLVDFNELATLNSTVYSLSLDVFGFNVTEVTAERVDALQQLNALTAPDTFTMANVQTCVPSHYGQKASAVAQLQSAIEDSLQVQAALTQLLSTLQANVSTAVASANAMRAQADATFASFLAIAADVAPVVNAGQAVVSSAYCGGIGVDYFAAKHAYCSAVQRGVGMIALSTFLIALALIPAIVLSWMRSREEEDYSEDGEVVSPAIPPTSPLSAYPAPYGAVSSPSASYAVRDVEVGIETVVVAPPPLPMRPPRVLEAGTRGEATSGMYPVVSPQDSYPVVRAPAPPFVNSYHPPFAPSYEQPQYTEASYNGRPGYAGEAESS